MHHPVTHLGKLIRDARKAKRIKLVALPVTSNVTGGIERGVNRNPSAVSCVKLCQALDISPSDFFIAIIRDIENDEANRPAKIQGQYCLACNSNLARAPWQYCLHCVARLAKSALVKSKS